MGEEPHAEALPGAAATLAGALPGVKATLPPGVIATMLPGVGRIQKNTRSNQARCQASQSTQHTNTNVSDGVLGHHLDIGHPMTTANGMLYSHNSTTIR